MYQKIRQSFSKNRIFFITILLIAIVPIGLVVAQYFAMRKAIVTLLEYQNDYRSYAMTLKRVIREKTKLSSEDSNSEVKKKINDSEIDEVNFPLGVEVFSSDCDEPLFRVVNRDTKHLRMNALAFARKHNIEASLLQWFQEQKGIKGIKEARKEKKIKRKKRVRRRKGVQTVQGMPLHLAAMVMEESDAITKHDFACQWPIKPGEYRMSSGFGPRKIARRGWRMHWGLDLAACSGTPVYAAGAGTVVQAGWYKGYGNCVTIAHGKKYKTRYGHLKKTHVKVGSKVQTGTLIGQVGNTGNVVGKNGLHLHFEVHSFGKPVNPLPFLKA